ncbi:MAG: hypothetical protein ACKVQT_34970 [Burkholderiales bacterium]
MPWSLDRYPAAMKHLPEPVLEKAIAIANALLAEGYDDGSAIRIAIGQAKAWARQRGIEIWEINGNRR